MTSQIETIDRDTRLGDQVSRGRAPLSVVVLTQDEAANIRACLKSVEWADDIVVIDSGSRDQTLEIAVNVCPRVRIFKHTFKDFGDQRNWALDAAGSLHDWVLFLDADERCTAECAEAIRRAIRAPGPQVGFFLTYRNFFLGRWIRHCTLYPSWQLRLLKLGAVRFQKEGHGQREVAEGALGYIREPYHHFGFSKGIEHWVERHNRYSSEEIGLIERLRNEPLQLSGLFSGSWVERRRCLKRLAARLPFRPLGRFVYTFVFRGGFLDGRAGLCFCLLRMAHDLHIVVKLEEARYFKGKLKA